MNNPISPTTITDRIDVLDFLRGIAILGILVINIESFALPDPFHPYHFGFDSPTDTSVRFWVYFLFQGKFFGIFTLLFGVGFYIFLQRLEKKNVGLLAIDIYGRRLLWLFLIGLIHAWFIWDGDVLYHYSICGLLLVPFRSFKVRWILLTIAIFSMILMYNSYTNTARTQQQLEAFETAIEVEPETRSPKDISAIETWKRRTSKSDVEQFDELISTKQGSYIENVTANIHHSEVLKGAIIYNGILLRTLIMMLLGIALYKLNVFSNYNSVPYYWPISIIIFLIALAINYYRYTAWSFDYLSPVVSVWQGWAFNFPKETLALGYVLLLNGLYQKFLQQNKFAKLLRSTGKMALTNYIMQSVICTLIFYGYGLGYYNQLSRSQLLLVVVMIWIIQVIASSVWLNRNQFGPLEKLWRRLTYKSFKSRIES